MNFDRDFKTFSAMLDELWELKGQVISAGAKTTFFRTLEGYPAAVVRAGLEAHTRDPKRGHFLPMPADVIAQIEQAIANDGRPEADEMWAVGMRGLDEAETIVWTTEAAGAWETARPVLAQGDEVGARMSFKATYTRLVAAARQQHLPASWTVSEGHDAKLRLVAIEDAVRAGRLPGSAAEQALLALPAPGQQQTLLELAQQSTCPPTVAENLERFCREVRERGDRTGVDGLAKAATAVRKHDAQQRVDEYLQQHPEARPPAAPPQLPPEEGDAS